MSADENELAEACLETLSVSVRLFQGILFTYQCCHPFSFCVSQMEWGFFFKFIESLQRIHLRETVKHSSVINKIKQFYRQ